MDVFEPSDTVDSPQVVADPHPILPRLFGNVDAVDSSGACFHEGHRGIEAKATVGAGNDPDTVGQCELVGEEGTSRF